MQKTIIHTEKAPSAIGPYSQAVKAGNMVFTSGQIPIIPETGDMIEGDVQVQTRRVLENIKAVLEAAGTDLEHVVKTTVYLKDMNDFVKMNEVYAQYFIEEQPSRSAVQVARLPKDASVEIDVIALIGE